MRRHWIVVAAGAAGSLVLLLLTAVGSRQEGWRGDGGSLRDVPHSITDAAYTLIILALIAVPVLVVLQIRLRLRPFQAGEGQLWLITVFFVTLAGVGAYILATSDVVRHLSGLLAGTSGEAGQSGGVRGPNDPGGTGRPNEFQWWLAVLVVAFALAGYVWYRRRNKPTPRPRRELAEQLEVVLEATLEDLELERDARRAVIRAYARMERVLGAYGLPRAPSEAPLEYLARILRELNVRAEAAHALTELFERARFSQHEIDAAMKAEAIAALATVRDELKAAA